MKDLLIGSLQANPLPFIILSGLAVAILSGIPIAYLVCENRKRR